MRARPYSLVVIAAAAMAGEACGAISTPDQSAPPPSSEVPGATDLTSVLVVSDLDQPVDLQAPAGDPRLFVVEQPGRIRIVRDGSLVEAPFLDIRDRVRSGGERGLLGLAFHPAYASNGLLYVNYTDNAGATRVVEIRVSSDPDRADPSSERLVLGVAQPFSNHNGGGLAFGPDGFLYIGLGDGGSAGDPLDLAQDLSVPLGKMLRIDVDSGAPFGVPPDNPFVGTPGAFPAIWAYGLRNPWRFSFDAETGDLLIGDVGQNQIEELDLDPSGAGGLNYGWNTMEGSQCFEPSSGCSAEGLTLPVVEYDHSQGCSVTSGYTYRGALMPDLVGTYFYGDFCTAFIRSFQVENGQAVEARDWTQMLNPDGRIGQLSSFGMDAVGGALRSRPRRLGLQDRPQ